MEPSATTFDELPILVIGAGQAAAEFAATLRSQGYGGRIVLIGDEPYCPYQRPPLSKAYLSGDIELDRLYVKSPEALEKSKIEVLLNTSVVSISRAEKSIRTHDGQSFRYSKLVLATGGRPRTLDPSVAPMSGVQNLHYLRTLDHVTAIRSQFKPGSRLVIVGGGYIGLEVAAVARKANIETTVIEAMPRILQRVTAPEMSAFYGRIHRDAGVQILENTALRGFEYDTEGRISAVLAGQDIRLFADLVVVGIGLIPNIELATEAGLAIDNGIAVDEFGRTLDPDIFAIGDCSSHPSAYAGRRLRLESVPSALEQARGAAAFIMGQNRPYNAIPWFWSDQYDLKLQMVGLSVGYDSCILRGSPERRSFLAFYCKEGCVIAVDSVNRLAEFMIAKKLVERRVFVSVDRLMDESQPLKELLPK